MRKKQLRRQLKVAEGQRALWFDAALAWSERNSDARKNLSQMELTLESVTDQRDALLKDVEQLKAVARETIRLFDLPLPAVRSPMWTAQAMRVTSLIRGGAWLVADGPDVGFDSPPPPSTDLGAPAHVSPPLSLETVGSPR